jgi:hypothetical protein
MARSGIFDKAKSPSPVMMDSSLGTWQREWMHPRDRVCFVIDGNARILLAEQVFERRRSLAQSLRINPVSSQYLMGKAF